jgi:hypothetical protein
MLKYLLLIGIILPMSKYQDDPIEILEVTGQEIIGGRELSGKRWHYALTIRTRANSRKLQFERIWIKQRPAVPSLWDMDKSGLQQRFSIGDTLLLVFTVTGADTEPAGIDTVSQGIRVPHYEGTGLVEMRFGRKKIYQEIDSVKVLDPLYLR